MRKHQSVIVYGIGRFQEDFEYLFPTFKVLGYITNNKKEYKGKKCYKESELSSSKLKRHTIIICDRKSDKITNKFNKYGLKYKKNYYYLEDIAYLLDDKIDKLTFYTYKYYYEKVKKWRHDDVYKSNGEYFRDMIYTDSIDNIKCDYPFKYVQIQPKGYVYGCCSGWTTKEIGNITYKSPKQVWTSNLARLHRLSIINKTYLFCSTKDCPYMTSSTKKTNSRFTDLVERKSPDEVCVAIDTSCNLKCPSCRKNFQNVKPGYHLKFLNMLANKITKSNWAMDSKEFIIASQGETFFSNVYRKMLFSSKVTRRDSIIIHTNGTLLTKSNLDKLCSKYKNIEIMISVDATCEETYKKIRCGGNFKQLMKNLENLSIARKEGRVKKVNLLFVIQRANYKEMIDYVKLVKRLGFDHADFSKIQNWSTFTDEEFENISMFTSDDKPKEEIKKILSDKIFKDDVVIHKNFFD